MRGWLPGLALLALLISAEALARDGGSKISVDAELGVTTFSGDLGTTSAASSYGLGIGVGATSWDTSFAKAVGGFGSFWSLTFTNIDGKSQAQPKFPFEGNKSLTVFATAFAPNFCFMTNQPMQACLGVGWEQFEVSQGSDYDQTYGDAVWTISIGRFFADGLHAGFKADYRSISQTVAGTKGNFAALSLLGVIGWQFRL